MKKYAVHFESSVFGETYLHVFAESPSDAQFIIESRGVGYADGEAVYADRIGVIVEVPIEHRRPVPQEGGRTEEPQITVNGKLLTLGQAMTVRVALNDFALSLNAIDALGEDETGRQIAAGYRARIAEIIQMMNQ